MQKLLEISKVETTRDCECDLTVDLRIQRAKKRYVPKSRDEMMMVSTIAEDAMHY